jgi:hypothetical protein
MLDPVEYVAMIAVARRRDLRSCSTCLAAHESVVPFVRKDSASSHKPIHHRTRRRPGCLAGLQVSDRRICRVRKVFALTGAIRTCSGALTVRSAPERTRLASTRSTDGTLPTARTMPAAGWLPLSGSCEGMPDPRRLLPARVQQASDGLAVSPR